MDGYVEDVNFCEYCGNILNEDGRCPDEECVYNLLLDVMNDTEEEATVEGVEPIEEDTKTTDDNSGTEPVDDEDEKGTE